MKKEQVQRLGSVVTNYDAERLNAIYMYARGKGVDVNKAMTEALDRLYARYVPPSVQEYLSMTSGEDGTAFPTDGSQQP